ncbi:hypothetical protein ACHAWX_004452 [Stephanocyclus meneghinianus]
MSNSQYGAMAIAISVLCTVFALLQINIIDDHKSKINAGMIQRFNRDAATETITLSSELNFAVIRYPSQDQRKRCQIVYILGAEGTMHHGVEPILTTFAKGQIDRETGDSYEVQFGSDDLRYGLFAYPAGRFGFLEPPSIDDPHLVSKVITAICPDDGKNHIIIESTSFPSGGKYHAMSRVRRQSAWHQMTPEGIANSFAALNHPTNLYQFYDAYHRYAVIKFVVLHRPFLNTIASHRNFDSGPMAHANVVQGYLILLSRFLDAYRFDKVTGEKIWTLLHVDKISSNNDADPSLNNQQKESRNVLIRNLAIFLDWPQVECPNCFDSWIDSTTDYVKILGNFNVKRLTKQLKELDGIWPPQET